MKKYMIFVIITIVSIAMTSANIQAMRNDPEMLAFLAQLEGLRSGEGVKVSAHGQINMKTKASGNIWLANGDSIHVGMAPIANTNKQQIVIERTFANLTLDPAFGINGRAIIPLEGTLNDVTSAQLQPDGKILINALVDDLPTQIRLNMNGTLDTSFGENGVEIISANKDKML